MSNLLPQRVSAGPGKTLAAGWVPVQIHYRAASAANVRFSNGQQRTASCLRCVSAPCAHFSEDEIVPRSVDGFPADRDSDVCAARAIKQADGGVPVVDEERCILCGVCSSRCPVGAIRLVPGRGAVVEDTPNDAFVEIPKTSASQNLLEQALFQRTPADGIHMVEDDQCLDEVFRRMERAWALTGDRFPNLLARNLLIGAGVGASLTRKGNNHMRMDLILSPPGVKRGIVEVEFGQDAALDAPRSMLDALAVMASRYDWNLAETTAVIVSDVLPNRRSEYWHIIQDVANVLGVKIKTVTILALILFNWNRWRLELLEDSVFYADRETVSYRAEILERVIRRALHLGDLPRAQLDIGT